MSIKTNAVDSRVYQRLTTVKREGESFSRLIDRLLAEVGAAYTGGDILRGLGSITRLSEADSEAFVEVIVENRRGEEWDRRDLR